VTRDQFDPWDYENMSLVTEDTVVITERSQLFIGDENAESYCIGN
jgi:hypothetical protein